MFLSVFGVARSHQRLKMIILWGKLAFYIYKNMHLRQALVAMMHEMLCSYVKHMTCRQHTLVRKFKLQVTSDEHRVVDRERSANAHVNHIHHQSLH